MAIGNESRKKIEDDDVLLSLPSQNEEYFGMISISALMKILKDPSLSVHHTAVVQAVMYIFKTLGLKCLNFLPQIIPPILQIMRSCPIGILEFYFQQLALLVSIVKLHIRTYLPNIFALVQEFWNPNSNIQITIISLVESIAIALDNEFKVYLPNLLTNVLSIFDVDVSEKRLPTQKGLHALIVFGSNLEEYLHLVIPSVVCLFERADIPVHIRKCAIQTMGQLCRKIKLPDYASRILHPLTRVLAVVELRTVAMDTISALVYQMNSDFAIFIPMINKILLKYRIQHQTYPLLINKLLKNEPLPQEINSEVDDFFSLSKEILDDSLSTDMSNTKKLPVNQQHLKRAWETTQKSTKEGIVV